MNKIVAIIQARLGSTRLPGKTLMPLAGRPVLGWCTHRLKQAQRLNSIVVATTTAPQDDAIEAFCRDEGIDCFRGSEDDVLGRFMAAAEEHSADWIVRVNADNPLIDPAYIDVLVDEAMRGGDDYLSFNRNDGKPVMLTAISFFAEALSRGCLERADAAIDDKREREHVTLGIYTRPDTYRVRFIPVPQFCDDTRLRLALDTQDDLDILRELFDVLGPRAENATAEEVVQALCQRPDWLATMARLNDQQTKTYSDRQQEDLTS
ncbi:MAG: cytidylyltransferase domain-containing protein [Planctomycetota bacterium]|jgi:spore coat polysaccharide biosynthesis protein SpsF